MKSKPNTKTGTGKKIKVYTAFDKAATLKIKPGTVAKVLTLKIGKELVLAAMGSDKNLNIEKLQKLAKTEKIAFAKEKAIVETFKGIDPGAIPPFAGLWNVKVFCDKKLLEAPKIILPSGSYEASFKGSKQICRRRLEKKEKIGYKQTVWPLIIRFSGD